MGTKHLEKSSAGKAKKDEQDKARETSREPLSRKNKKRKNKTERKKMQSRRRIVPIWLRLVIIILLAFIAFVLGIVIGYGILGDGNPTDAFKWETWQHIYDMIQKETE